MHWFFLHMCISWFPFCWEIYSLLSVHPSTSYYQKGNKKYKCPFLYCSIFTISMLWNFFISHCFFSVLFVFLSFRLYSFYVWQNIVVKSGKLNVIWILWHLYFVIWILKHLLYVILILWRLQQNIVII